MRRGVSSFAGVVLQNPPRFDYNDSEQGDPRPVASHLNFKISKVPSGVANHAASGKPLLVCIVGRCLFASLHVAAVSAQDAAAAEAVLTGEGNRTTNNQYVLPAENELGKALTGIEPIQKAMFDSEKELVKYRKVLEQRSLEEQATKQRVVLNAQLAVQYQKRL